MEYLFSVYVLHGDLLYPAERDVNCTVVITILKDCYEVFFDVFFFFFIFYMTHMNMGPFIKLDMNALICKSFIGEQMVYLKVRFGN